MIVRALKTRVFQEGDDLFAFISHYFSKLSENSVVVVTSKIAALAEGRTAIAKDIAAKVKLIRAESDWAVQTKHVWLTIKDGMMMASAGIDESNANGKIVLLPKDSFKVARILRQKLQKKYGVRNLGIIITDSRTMPMCAGVVGVALGYAGFSGIRDYRGKPDIYGRKFKFSRTNVADSLATAAVFMMGEGNEQRPLALIKNAPVVFIDKTNRNELRIDPEEDMYRPLYTNQKKR